MSRLPSFVVLGEGKAGTSLIYRMLERHPDIALCKPKELHFFSAHFDKGVDWYASHFADLPNDRMIGEVSPSYLSHKTLPRLASILPQETKLIFVLRRPIERLYARYLQNICARRAGPQFREVTRKMPARMRRLHEAIGLCYSLFPPENILPLFFERDIAGSSSRVAARIFDHLGLSAQKIASLPDHRINPTVMPHWILTGDSSMITFMRGRRYVLPRNQLFFCAQPRNACVIRNPSPEQVQSAFCTMSQWSRSVPACEYADLQQAHVLPMADLLERDFGFDMAHWRIPPTRLLYEPGLPAERFQKDAPQNG